jgi:tripeptidyl-peptidase-1
VAGTSCSAPIIGGLIASLNNELLQKGQAPLGFINPWLYANPQVRRGVNI